MPEPGASPFFNPLLADVACPGLDNLDGSEESNVWAPLPLREWASHLLAPLFRKRARNAAARNARATKRTNNRHPSNTTISAKATARAAAPSGLRLSGVAALMQSGLVRASAVLFTSPPSAWPLAPRLSVLMYHSTWLHSSPAYALVTGCSSSLSTVIARTAQEGNEDLQTPQSCEGSSRTTSASAPHRRSASLAAWQKNHPVQIGPCDASQRRAVALALQGESFVLRGPPGCGKTNTLAAMVR
jgi:flagellar biosynthesis GTPase FlhF